MICKKSLYIGTPLEVDITEDAADDAIDNHDGAVDVAEEGDPAGEGAGGGGGPGQPDDGEVSILESSLSKHMGDGKLKLGRGPYAISTAILSMYAGFQLPRTKYMLAPGHRKMNFLCGFSCGFAKLSI